MRRLLMVAWVTLALPAAALTPAGKSLAQEASGVPGLAALRSAYVAAYNEGNADAMESLYVEAAVRMPYDTPAQEGRAAIIAYYRRAFAARRFNPTLTFAVDEVLVRGDVAVERGYYREELRPKGGGASLVEVGKYMAVARQGDDGRWRFAASIFNRDATSAPPGPARPAYRTAGGVERCLESNGGTRIEVLLDSAGLGGPEFELARITFPPGQNPQQSHRHRAVEAFYVLKGELEHVVNGAMHVLEPGMVGVVRPGDEVIHRVRGDEPVEAVVIWAPAGELGRIEAVLGACRDR